MRGTKTLNFSITKATPVVTAPTAKNLHYYGKSQTLINAGSTTLGTLEYSLDGTTYSTSLPTAWKAGTYTVYYRVSGTANYNSVAAKTISVTITKNKATVTAPTAKTITYNGAARELVTAGSTTYGKLQYSLDGKTYSESIPTATNAGTYTVYYKVDGTENYDGFAAKTISVKIQPKSIADLTFGSIANQVYTGSAIKPIVTIMNGEYPLTLNKHYTVNYSNNTNAGTASVVITGTGNYTGTKTLNFSITKATPVVTAPTANALTYTGTAQALVTAGKTTGGTMQYSLDGTNYSTSIPTATKIGTYTVYYKVVGNTNYNNIAAKTLTVTIESALEITSQPTDFTGVIGDTAKFTVEATGENLTYQWYQNTGAGWTAINTTAGRKATFSIGITATRTKYQYRCVVSDGTTELTSDAVMMVIEEAFEITSQPTNFTGAIGDTAKFTVKATGENLTYQWYQNTGAGWTAINTTAGRKATFSIGVTAARAKYQYRCVVSDGTTELTSDAVKMVIEEAFEITSQPTNFTGVIGDTAKFTVEATGENLTYQWYQNTGAGWTAINTTAGHKATFSIGVTAARAKYQYRCVVSDGTNSITSDAVKMVIEETFEITSQPTNFTGAIGDTAKFTVEATGENLTYQWYQNTGAGWTAINTTAGRKATFSIGVTAARTKYQYRCVVSDGTTELTSDAVKMVIEEAFEIITQPSNYIGAIGDTAKFTVEATGATSYQWYQNTGAGWTAINTTAGRSKTFSVAIAEFRLGYMYRCVVSDGTNTITSDEVQMYIG